MKLEFAKASPAQREAIHRLMRRAFTPYVRKLGRQPKAGPHPGLEAAISRGDVYIALDEGEIVGVVATSRRGDELAIEALGVDPARQGGGIGGWLLEQIEQTARRDQIKALTLFTAEMMSDVVRLYDRHGFLVVRKALPAHGRDEHLRVHMKKLL
jgi:N-acetylglutamate synthase-like GNAT family acetyltransferase